MQNSVGSEINELVSCFVLGLLCGIIFDFFKAIRYGKYVKAYQLVLQDVLYYIIVSGILFNFILKLNGAEIRAYIVFSVICAFLVYRLTISRYVVRILIYMFKLVKYIIKIALLPVLMAGKIIILPYLRIKQKLLSKKAKIALTFKQICFKIKCNVGMLYIGKKICKERKPCRKEQKPKKRV